MKKIRTLLAGVLSAGCVLLSIPVAPVTVFAEEEYPADVREMPTGDYTGKTVIIHSNDVHGAIDGYAMMTAMKEAFEELGAEVIMADAGDFSQGGPYVNTDQGADAVTMMNAAGYDVATIGNHEFDFGEEVLSDNLKKAQFNRISPKTGKSLCRRPGRMRQRTARRSAFSGLIRQKARRRQIPKRR